MAVVLALVAAGAWGCSDFLGGAASREDHPVTVTLWSQALSVIPLTAAALLLSPLAEAPAQDLWRGAAVGIAGGGGVLMLFRGLAVGRMAVVAPITALVGAGVPVIFGIVQGETPSLLAGAGLVGALVAIWLIASAHAPVTDEALELPTRTAGVPQALVAGVGFAGVYVLLDGTTHASGLWPLAVSKGPLLLLVGGIAAWRRRPAVPGPGVWRTLVAIAILDTTAITSYLLASRRGLLALVAVVASLYPAGTVLLARWRLDERLTRTQLGGLVLAGGAVTLITVG